MKRYHSSSIKYLRGIAFIALNDEPNDSNVGSIADYLSVITLSEAFSIKSLNVAKDVLKFRNSYFRREARDE